MTWVVLLTAMVLNAAWAQSPAEFFQRNCVSCHTIGGGRLTGPDLKDVAGRQDRDWLVRFMQDPKAMIDTGDPYAVKIKQESRDVIMPKVPSLNSDMANALLDLITAESLLDVSRFVGLQIGDEPFTLQQISSGQKLFSGEIQLANGGAACISCHTVRGLGGLSGGRLGPDLTRVYERLQGRRALASWLLAPATSTMQPLFADRPMQQDEILPLVAYLEDKAKRGGEDDSVAILKFFIIGFVGVLVALALFDAIWRGRFVAVRRPQVETAEIRGIKDEN